jgi:hypothetical protein
MSQPDASPSSPSPQELKAALKAFRKRLKALRLDDESRLGHGAMTGGIKSGVVGIAPPKEFPQALWNELARQGKLKSLGHGLYELREP